MLLLCLQKQGLDFVHKSQHICWLLHVFQRIHERRQQLLLLHMCEIMRASKFNILIHIGLMNPMLMVIQLFALVVINRTTFLSRRMTQALLLLFDACVIDESSLLFHKTETLKTKTAGQSFQGLHHHASLSGHD